ncbi:hypothetical protein [Sulfuricurvum sp.]|uniref:hypothetical protein n=1 Tax=Sulfuricurvum sp. TaxID=2025608 RepID=UPI00261B135E|nr:hypothetical protein [Sulfuricurvum sp.]MDD3597436.1 hypothetical protein [Sulfuricurvum sp.]
MKLKKGEIYYLYAPVHGQDDLARPGFWESINFDAAPFLLMDLKKSNNENVYIWGEWVLVGFVESIEHFVPSSEIDAYEDRWVLADDERLLKAVKDTIRANSMKVIKNSEGDINA